MILFKHIQQPHIQWFMAGSALGAIVGGNLVIALPTGYLRLLLGCFILFSVWGPTPQAQTKLPQKLSMSGALSTLLTMFVGATGPFVMASLRPFGFKAVDLVATNAACLASQYSLKLVAFSLLGFAFSDYLIMIVLMITTAFIGTLAGRNVLLKVNEDHFRRVLNIVLTVLALRLLYSGLHFISRQ